MNKTARFRGMGEWYTVVNTFCLFRLWKMQEEEKIVIEHKDLDAWQRKVLDEVGLEPKDGWLMSHKFAHDNGVVLYNTSEDLDLLAYMKTEKMFKRELDNLDLVQCAKDALQQLGTKQYFYDFYASFDELKLSINKILKTKLIEDQRTENPRMKLSNKADFLKLPDDVDFDPDWIMNFNR